MTYDENVAILFIIFRRPNTTQKILDRIKEVKPKRLYIAADGPRNETEQIECEKTRSLISGIDWECQLFKLYQEKNLGCDPHCFQAISWFFEHEPEGIVLEDDCLPSHSFFSFCTTLLEKYRNDERIGHITGGNYQFGKKRGDGTYYFSHLTHVWGWASWRRVWQHHRLQGNNYELFEQLDYLSYLPSHAPFQYYWNPYFQLANDNRKFGWDCKYAYTNLTNNRLSIIPNYNLISNIGCSDKATHYVKDHPFANIRNEEIDDMVHPPFICPDIEADLYSQAKEYNTSFEPLSIPKDYIYLKEQLNTTIDNNHIYPKIPRIIHQIYEDLSGPPSYLKSISKSWKELNPDWEYRFWDKNDMEAFLKEYYPELMPTYQAFPYNVQRWDAIRYLILYQFGGLYVDMDYECTENITSILCNLECGMGLEPEAHAIRNRMPYLVGNAFMATVPNHPYFKELIDAVFYDSKDESSSICSDNLVLNTTGPFMTTRIYNNSKYKEQVTLIPGEIIAPLTQGEVRTILENKTSKIIENKIERSFAIHYFFNSWCTQTKEITN